MARIKNINRSGMRISNIAECAQSSRAETTVSRDEDDGQQNREPEMKTTASRDEEDGEQR